MDEVSDRWFMIPIEGVAYLFPGSALHRGLIHSQGDRAPEFHFASVYIRSGRGGIFQTAYRSLSEVARLLDQRFVERLTFFQHMRTAKPGSFPE
jgi:hypothetical protein